MTGRSFNPLRLIVVGVVAALVAVGLLVTVVLAVVLRSSASDDDPARTAPDAPADLCAVIGRDDLAIWSPGTEAVASADGAQATCEASTPDVEGADDYVLFTAHLTRGPERLGRTSGADQTSEWLAIHCADPTDDDLGLGDESCLARFSGAGATASAEVAVRQGADLVRVSYDGHPLGTIQAKRRVVDAAERILAALEA